MRELNYVEGRNLTVSVALAHGQAERLPNLVDGLLKANVDVVVTTSTPETQGCQTCDLDRSYRHDSRAGPGGAGTCG
jgi:hypothetical protein